MTGLPICPDCAAHPGWSSDDNLRRRDPQDVCRACYGSGVAQPQRHSFPNGPHDDNPDVCDCGAVYSTGTHLSAVKIAHLQHYGVTTVLSDRQAMDELTAMFNDAPSDWSDTVSIIADLILATGREVTAP